MATQAEVNELVALANRVLSDCYGPKGLKALEVNFDVLSAICRKLREILKKEGYIGVGLVVELFPKRK